MIRLSNYYVLQLGRGFPTNLKLPFVGREEDCLIHPVFIYRLILLSPVGV
jgi:hypothetical protein